MIVFRFYVVIIGINCSLVHSVYLSGTQAAEFYAAFHSAVRTYNHHSGYGRPAAPQKHSVTLLPKYRPVYPNQNPHPNAISI
jgi:hypothetical protein